MTVAPARIVSVLPSATEIIALLGLADRLTGLSHSCDAPPGCEDLPRLTATRVPTAADSATIDQAVRSDLAAAPALYTLDLAGLQAASPDVVVSQALCDVCAVSAADIDAALAHVAPRPQLINMEPATFAEVMASVRLIGTACARAAEAEAAVAALQARVAAVRARTETVPQADRPRVMMVEWLDPPFNAGHWTPELVKWAGGVPLLGAPGRPARTLDPAEIAAASPEVVVLAACGLDLPRTLEDLPHLAEWPGFAETPAARAGAIHAVDGRRYFSRPSPSLVDAVEILAHLLHPAVHPAPQGLGPDAWRREVRAPIAVG